MNNVFAPLGLAVLLGLGTLSPVMSSTATAREACGSGHIAIALTGFQSPGFFQHYYHAVEGDSSFKFTVAFEGDNCANDRVSAKHNVADVTTASGVDYTHASGRTEYLCDTNHGCSPGSQDIPLPITEDQTVEPTTGPGAAETARIFLSDPMGGRLSQVSSAPLHIIDNDGPERIAFNGMSFSQSESYAQVHIPVYRAGDPAAVGTSATVTVATSPTGASPATEGEDYTAPAGITFEPGDQVGFLTFSIKNDTQDEAQEETFNLTISGTGVVEPSSTTFTILDNEEQLAPQSRLHHPRQGRKYERGDYRLREIHVFTSDQGGSAVVRAELALRKNLRNGKCAWWTRKDWKSGACGARRWINLASYDPGKYYHRMGPLRPSMRGKIRDYTAFSRAIDGAGNVESMFEPGRNENTFEVRKRKGRRR